MLIIGVMLAYGSILGIRIVSDYVIMEPFHFIDYDLCFVDFGELLTWWSIYFACLPCLNLPQAFIALLSPSFITYLIMNVSGVPLLEDMADKKYKNNKEYQQYKAATSVLVPWPIKTKKNTKNN
jgi:hypothetical protein